MENRLTDVAPARKARGAFFTPAVVAEHIVEWAVRDPRDRVLEPSCGEAEFLIAAGARVKALTRDDATTSPEIFGIEIHHESAERARARVREHGGVPDIAVMDFFESQAFGQYDVVVGNPPFIRYQNFSGVPRANALRSALVAGVALSGLTSSWAPFVVHAARHLRVGGRLGLVLPAELLSVNYASEIRSFLLREFGSVELVLFHERVFPEVQEEVLLLLASEYGRGPVAAATVRQVNDAAALGQASATTNWSPVDPAAKWTRSLVSARAAQVYEDILASGAFVPLSTWGSVSLGAVTGNNHYFALSPESARERGLTDDDLIDITPPGSAHLRGLELSREAWHELGDSGRATKLFLPRDEHTLAVKNYIADGAATGVSEGYKCRVRSPWWKVPLAPVADHFLTYMNSDTPRFCLNAAGVRHLNSVHGVYIKSEHKALARSWLATSTLNSMTFLGAEFVGRAYGGGMLKLEPGEAANLPVPSPALLRLVGDRLRAVVPQLGTPLRGGHLREAASVVDEILLTPHIGLSRSDLDAVRSAHRHLFDRRKARGRNVSN